MFEIQITNLADAEGIEPSLAVLEAAVLPLNDAPVLWNKKGFEPLGSGIDPSGLHPDCLTPLTH